MNELEQELLREATGTADTQLAIRTATRIDAGRWWRKTPVWICLSGGDLAILAVARRRHFEKISMSVCSDSHYNHATGELVIEPSGNLTLDRFRISLPEALRVLKQINPRSIFQTPSNRQP